jgi:hypothetical protein
METDNFARPEHARPCTRYLLPGEQHVRRTEERRLVEARRHGDSEGRLYWRARARALRPDLSEDSGLLRVQHHRQGYRAESLFGNGKKIETLSRAIRLPSDTQASTCAGVFGGVSRISCTKEFSIRIDKYGRMCQPSDQPGIDTVFETSRLSA